MNKTDLENLKKLSKEFYEQFRKIQDKVTEIEEVPFAKYLVGKCYKYLNSYGPKESWFLYTKILSNDGTNLKTEMFQEDFYEKIEFDYDKLGYSGSFKNSNYILITEKEYFKEQKKLIDKMHRKYNRSASK